jgi:hypothetical protein
MALRELVKKNEFLYKLAVGIVRFGRACKNEIIHLLYFPRKLVWSIGIFLRRQGIVEFKKYANIKKLKNKHDGERCFIVCTGPSLTVEDVDKLKDETCFGINSILNIFGSTAWRPKYYTVANHKLLCSQLAGIYKEEGLSYIIYPNTTKCMEITDKEVLYQYPILNLVLKRNEFKLSKNDEYIFSDDIYAGVTGGGTTTNAILQVAVYMGFKEIYLIGADCDFGGDQKYFRSGGSDGDYSIKYDDEKVRSAEERSLIGFIKAKEYADSFGIKIYNATRGGKLEVFPRVDLDEVLGLK